MGYNPTLLELIELVASAKLEGVHVSCTAGVVKYDAVKQTADVKPTVKRRRGDVETGEAFYVEYPTIPNVRVRWPMGGGFGLTLPLAKGDHVELVFGHDPNSEFRAGTTDAEPLDSERHGLSAAWAYPTSGNDADVFAASSASKAVLGHATGARVEFTPTKIDAGPGGTPVANAAKTIAADQVLATAIGAIYTAVAALPPGPVDQSTFLGLLTAIVPAAVAAALAAPHALLPTTVFEAT